MATQTRQQTPTKAPAAAQGGTASSDGGRLDRMQRTMGNQAVQEHLNGQGQGASPAGAGGGVQGAQTALKDNTEGASLSVRGRLPAHATLGGSGGNEVTTDKSTGFEVGVGREGVWATFNPALLVRPGSMWQRLATGGITVSQLYFGFQDGKASLSFDTGMAGDFLDLFMDLKGGIEAKFAAAVKGAMPARLQQGGYDPYTDPELASRLASVVSSLSGSFPGSGAAPGANLLDQITSPEISAHVTPKPMEIPISDGMVIRLSERASLGLTARLSGTMGEALKRPQLTELVVETDGLTLESKKVGLLGGLTLRSLVFGPDLSLVSLDYTLGAETGLGLLKLLGAVAELRTGQDLGVHDTDTPELEALRERVDTEARQKLPAMLRDQVRLHDNDIPGLPLHDLVRAAKS